MEIQGSNGSKIQIKPNSQPTILGRGNGFPSHDLTISRRHISFHFNTQTPPTLSFEVHGKNPFWVHNKHPQGQKIKSFKRFQRGELGIHDLFCVSPKNPVWFSLKVIDNVGESQRGVFEGNFNDELSQSLESYDFELGFVDVSSIDPLKEFGFLVIGHEFDQYPRQMIREIKNWDWFLDDPRKDTEDDEDEDEDEDEDSKRKRNKGGRKKRKKTSKGDNDADEEWTAESEGEEQTANVRKVQRPKYHTRSKDHGALPKRKVTKKSSAGTSRRDEEEEESEDEEDETLGGFIADDNTTEEEVENEMDEDEDEDEEEEEEFMEDEDELED